MNTQIQALAMLPKLSEQQLMQALQSGSTQLPTYAVMAELQARKKRMAGTAGPAPTTSVKDEMMQAGLPPMRPPGMAEGGLLYGGEMSGLPEDSGWAQLRGYFADPNRKPLWDALMEKLTPAPSSPSSKKEASAPAAPRLREQDRTPVAAPAMPTSAAAKPTGLKLISASIKGGSAPGPVPAAPAYEARDVQMASLQDTLKGMPEDTTLRDQLQEFRNAKGDLASRREQAKYEALIHAGLGMAATPGRLGQAIAQGGLRGMQAYGEGMKGINADERERMKEMALLSRAASEQALQRQGIANQARIGDANLGVANQKNRTDVHQTAMRSRDVDATNAAHIKAAGIMASARESAGGDKVLKHMMDAEKYANAEVAKMPLIALGAQTGNPAGRAKYEAELQKHKDSYMRQIGLRYPDVWEAYQQLQGALGASQAPGVIRGGAPPQGVTIRQ